MREGLRVGRLFGIDIVVDTSWVFIFLLVAWNLTAVFSNWHPTWSLGASFFLAVVAALLFFASVLAHEFCHALVALSYGVPVSEIRLFLFGGVSNIEREPPSPAAEFWISIMGPLMSLGIGFDAALVSSYLGADFGGPQPLDAVSRLDPATTLLFWLGPVNVGIGLFNLLPGFPLDGGRILRAAIWRATGDLRRATLTASTVGRAIGWTFIAAGIAMTFGIRVPLFGQGAGGGIWLAFIGWFLSSAAVRSYQSLLLEDAVEGVRVGDLMRARGAMVPADTRVGILVRDWFMHGGQRAYPVVVQDGELAGIVCVGDVRKTPATSWDATPVTAIMTPLPALATSTPNDPLSSALRALAKKNVEQLPVLQGGRLVGMLERRDVARWLELRLGETRAPTMPRAV